MQKFEKGGLVFTHRGTAVRIGVAAFCLAAFVLNKAYSSVLISFATTPIFRPLIKSVYDLPKNPGVYVTVDKDQGTDVFLRVQYLYRKRHVRKHSIKIHVFYFLH